jgi:hypothetical protein
MWNAWRLTAKKKQVIHTSHNAVEPATNGDAAAKENDEGDTEYADADAIKVENEPKENENNENTTLTA